MDMDDTNSHPLNTKDRNTNTHVALRAGLCLRSKTTGQCYTVGQNLAIFTPDYPDIHPNFILAHDIRELIREGELLSEKCNESTADAGRTQPEGKA